MGVKKMFKIDKLVYKKFETNKNKKKKRKNCPTFSNNFDSTCFLQISLQTTLFLCLILVCDNNFHSNKFSRQARMTLLGHRRCR